jgi:ethanolamine utilization protein EutQ (cupin superfamily)
MAGKRLITGAFVASEVAAGRRRIAAPRASAVITPEAWTQAFELGVTFDRDGETVTPPAPAGTPGQGSSERQVDPSGLVLVRGDSVKLGAFTAAGPGKHVGLLDLVTGRDGSPMTAGLMSWGREDSFDWKLDYDEVDYVLEGVLQISIAGRTLEGRPGDVFYIPKGSAVRFGTPWRTRVFYVTYPADWAAVANAPARPQK